MTPHINAIEGDIAETVIMPGDPLRAKYIAKTYLKEYKTINTVRNMLGYTGYYNDKRVTVMASGMGIPSMGIYSYELYKFYNVKNIIRIGTAGAYKEDLKLYDIVLATSSHSESSYAKVLNGETEKIVEATEELTKKLETTAKSMDIKVRRIRVNSTEAFYNETEVPTLMVAKYGCEAAEMETFALFNNAKYFNRNAACLLTISDNLVTGEKTTSEERETKLDQMIKIALETIWEGDLNEQKCSFNKR